LYTCENEIGLYCVPKSKSVKVSVLYARSSIVCRSLDAGGLRMTERLKFR
jgi:hypothetical protein